MDNETLQQHILSTYNSLRLGMGIIAAAAPVVIVAWGLIFHIGWQDSLSAYYFAPSGYKWEYSPYPARVLFVGVLFALGSYLFMYKGFSKREDFALNLAGLFAIGIALCPMYTEADYIPRSYLLHFIFAILFYICLAYTAICCHKETLRFVADEEMRRRYKFWYAAIGWFLGLFPLIGLALAMKFQAVQRQAYWIEAIGVWVFAAYWFLKSYELKKSQADLKAATGTLRHS